MKRGDYFLDKHTFIVCTSSGADGQLYKERKYCVDGRLLEYESNYEDSLPYRTIDGIISLDDWHYMIENISKGWLVRSESTDQYGIVTDIITNKYDIPVCLRVMCHPDEYYTKSVHGSIDNFLSGIEYDYISIDRVTEFEALEDGYYLDETTGVLCEDEEYWDNYFKDGDADD